MTLQCRITGTNPLAQETAAAVLGTRTGRKSGESFTPKALKCLYNVFSIKDTITKKEAREISGLCGATVTQVREFFSGQRSRVRKLVQLSHEEAGACNVEFGVQPSKQNPLNGTEGLENLSGSEQVTEEQSRYCSLLDGFSEKTNGLLSKSNTVETAENFIAIMRKENTFIGQIQLAQVILQAHQGPVLRWFMVKGGLQQIIKWLVQAAAEEQTSLIRLLLKTIGHLPLGSASARQMSALLQTVNKLRFYRAQDVASRARLLLSRWSRFLRSTINARMLSSAGLTSSFQPTLKRGRDVTVSHTESSSSKKKLRTGNMIDSSRHLDVDSNPSTMLKDSEQRVPLEIPSEVNATKKRPARSLLQADRFKERRKVQLFEEARLAVRRSKDAEITRSSSADLVARPLSADDIKKAKRRAHLLQSLSSSRVRKLSDRQSSLPLCCKRSAHPSTQQCSVGTSHSDPEGKTNNFSAVKNFGNTKSTSEVEKTSPRTVNDLQIFSCSSKEGACENAYEIRSSRSVFSENSELEAIQHKPEHVLNAAFCHMLEASDGAGVQISNRIGKLGSHQVSSCASTFESSNANDHTETIEGCRSAAHSVDFNIIQWMIPPRMVLDPRWRVANGEGSAERSSQFARLCNEQQVVYASTECIPSNPQEPLEKVSLFVDDTLVPEIFLEAMAEDSQDSGCSSQSPTECDQREANVEEAESKVLDEADTADCLGHQVDEVKKEFASRYAETDSSTCRFNVTEDARKTTHLSLLNAVSCETIHTKLDSSVVCAAIKSNQNDPLRKDSGVSTLTRIPSVKPSEDMTLTTIDRSLQAGSGFSVSNNHILNEAEKGITELNAQDNSSTALKQPKVSISIGKVNDQLSQPNPDQLVSSLKKQISSDLSTSQVSTMVQADKSKFDTLKGGFKEKKPLSTPKSNIVVAQHGCDSKGGVDSVEDLTSEHKENHATFPSSTCTPLLAENLASSSSKIKKNIAGSPGVPMSLDFGVSVSFDLASKLQDPSSGQAGRDTHGLNLSELSKEACVDMLKVVLKQLADTSVGSGADLELLSLFLKHPDIVYALTSSQVLPPGKDPVAFVNSFDVMGANNASNTSKDLSTTQVEKLLSMLMTTSTGNSLNTRHELIKVVTTAATSAVALPAQLGPLIAPSSRPAVPQQLRPPLPPMPPPMPSSIANIDQVMQSQHIQNYSGGSHFLLQSSQPTERNIFQIPKDIASHDAQLDWRQHIHQHPHSGSSEQIAGFVSRPPLEISTSIRPSLTQCSVYREKLQPHLGIAPAGHNRASLLQREAVNLSLPTRQVDVRGQPSVFMQGPLIPLMGRGERQINGQNGLCFPAIPNVSSELNIKSREIGTSDGILRVPGSAHSKDRFQQAGVLHESHARAADQLPGLISNVRGSQIITQAAGNPGPFHSTFRSQSLEQRMRPPPALPPATRQSPLPPVLTVPVPSDPLRPQGDVMIWQPRATQSNFHTYPKPAWRG